MTRFDQILSNTYNSLVSETIGTVIKAGVKFAGKNPALVKKLAGVAQAAIRSKEAAGEPVSSTEKDILKTGDQGRTLDKRTNAKLLRNMKQNQRQKRQDVQGL